MARLYAFIRSAAITFIGFAALTGAVARADEGTLLTGEAIRETVSGKRIYLAIPFGGEFPLYYQRDGRVDGSGEAVGLGRFLRPTDSGKWWIEKETLLCQQWTSWYDGRKFCFELRKLQGDKLAWFRDDGEKGTARIGDAEVATQQD
ncbi:MAG: hypothetical protein ACKOC1_02115 [Hyphomicrobiales bacterium]